MLHVMGFFPNGELYDVAKKRKTKLQHPQVLFQMTKIQIV